MRTTALTALAIMLLAGCRVERTERPALADAGSVARADIQNTFDEFQTALTSYDARRATTFFAPDARLMLPSTEHHGRPEIGDGLEQALLADSTAVVLTSDVLDLSGSAAWQAGSIDFRSPAAEGQGRFIIRWQRGPEGVWRMQQVMISRTAPDSAAT